MGQVAGDRGILDEIPVVLQFDLCGLTLQDCAKELQHQMDCLLGKVSDRGIEDIDATF